MRVLSNIHRNSFPFSITRVTHLAIHPFLLSTLSLRHQPFDFARSIVAFMCDHFALDFARLSTSRYQDRLSLEFDPVFFFNLPYPLCYMRHACLFILSMYQFSKPLRTRAIPSSRAIFATHLRRAFLQVRLRSSPYPVVDTFLGKGILKHSCEFQFIRVRFASSLRLSNMMREERFLTTMITKLMKRSICAWHLRVNYFDINSR